MTAEDLRAYFVERSRRWAEQAVAKGVAVKRRRAALVRDFRAGGHLWPAGSDFTVADTEGDGYWLSVLRPVPGVVEVGDLVGPVPREAVVVTKFGKG